METVEDWIERADNHFNVLLEDICELSGEDRELYRKLRGDYLNLYYSFSKIKSLLGRENDD